MSERDGGGPGEGGGKESLNGVFGARDSSSYQ